MGTPPTRDAWGQRRHQRRERARLDRPPRRGPPHRAPRNSGTLPTSGCATSARPTSATRTAGSGDARPSTRSPRTCSSASARAGCAEPRSTSAPARPRGASDGRRRAAMATSARCTIHRGASACPNGSHLPREATEAAVLQALDAQALDAEVAERVRRGRRAAPRAGPPPPGDDAARRARLAEIDGQLARFTDAIALGAGAVPTRVKQMTALQRQRDALAAEATLASTTSRPGSRVISGRRWSVGSRTGAGPSPQRPDRPASPAAHARRSHRVYAHAGRGGVCGPGGGG